MELQAYIKREEYLLAELAAARSQVDKLLDQQQVLLNMIARLSGLSGPLEQASGAHTAMIESPAAPTAAPAPAPTATAAARAAAASPVPTISRAGSASISTAAAAAGATTSATPKSLADLFRSAAATAPHPAGAAAAASIAAAIAAVDAGDILTTSNVLLSPGPPLPSSSGSSSTATLPLLQPSLLFDTLGGFTVASAAAASTASAPSSPSSSGPSVSSSSGSSTTATADSAVPEIPVESAKAAPTDAPPELFQGDDDIFWLSKLHAALEEKGFFPGDDDMENWFFGETTLSAVLAFQASVQLPEIGTVDRPTWTALLGVEVAEELYGRVTQAASSAPSSGAASSAAASLGSEEAAETAAGAVRGADTSMGNGRVPEAAALITTSTITTKWPVLMEGDGGREVHALQVALSNSGFNCGDDDMRWWQFGDGTLTALKFFQSCSGIPESGVCDERSWRVLLGEASQPADLYSLRLAVNSDDEDSGYTEDMEGLSQGRVWLLGEQRWERRV